MEGWSHIAPAHIASAMTASFLASAVEFIEALTVVLAVGSVRGWRGALTGAAAALTGLAVLVAVFGPALTLIPIGIAQIVVGALLLLFGLRWLRKAILRAAGVIALHDEAAAFAKQTQALAAHGATGAGFDRIGFATAFQITLLEGLEVVFIVVAVGAGGGGLIVPAAIAAIAALVVVVILGAIVRGPLSRVPENALKFVVGVLLSGFGCFWLGEGLGIAWPGDDWSILALLAGFLVVALAGVRLSAQALKRATA